MKTSMIFAGIARRIYEGDIFLKKMILYTRIVNLSPSHLTSIIGSFTKHISRIKFFNPLELAPYFYVLLIIIVIK